MEDPISINRRFLRSVNLVNDCRSSQGLAGYVVTPSVRKALSRIKGAFTTGDTERAFTLTAPYGTGKSSFGLFFYHLLSAHDDPAWEILSKADEPLAHTLYKAVWGKRSASKGYLVLMVTARRASVAELLAEAFDGLENRLPKALIKSVEELRSSRDSKNSLRLVTVCATKLCSEQGYQGVFFVFDEFGKVFEHARHASKDADVFLLQELAEAACRSRETPMFMLGMLHQSFADYVAIDTPLRKEFSKIEGRFEPISFVETVSAQIQLIASAFPEKTRSAPGKEVQSILRDALKTGLPALSGIQEKKFSEFALRSFPMHPMTLAALPLLFRRFGQNERSIFSYLTSNEPNGLQDFARRNPQGTLIRLCDVFDYFFENYEVQLGRHPYGQAFLEANAVIRSRASLTPTDIEVVKTVAVLTSLGMQSPINATEDLITLSLRPTTFTTSLKDLLSQSILVYRKFNKAYALWSGSDIDLRECYEQADKELGKAGFSVAGTLGQFLPPLPIVAKRHSLIHGALRYFETRYVDAPRDLDHVVRTPLKSGAAGRILVCLPTQESEAETFLSDAVSLSRTMPEVLFAIPCNISELTDALMEVRRLNWIEENIHGLRDDRIARREVAIRKAEANQSVTQFQYGLLDPRPAPAGGACQYVHGGTRCDTTSNKDVSILLSSICERLYPSAPVVLNELINKRNPSSQAASARNTIIKRLNNPESVAKPRLGIEGFPPERSIYESLLSASGMHREENGTWRLSAPCKTDPVRLLPVWKRIEELVFESREQPLVLEALYAELAKPPFGVLDGLMPILVTAFYVLNRDEVSLYSENSFVPEPQDAQLELMVRRPELFAISGMHIRGTRQLIVDRLAAGLQTEATVLDVVRKLYAMMGTLSKYAQETNSVSEQTQRFRRVFMDAKSPERLLFVELPEVFGLQGIDGSKRDAPAFDRYFNGLNACTSELAGALPALIGEHRKLLLEACGYENSQSGWQALYDRASFLLARIGGSEIGPFLQNVVNTAGDWTKATQVMAYIQQAPMDKWGTLQIEEFHKNALGIADRFKTISRSFEQVPAALGRREREMAEDLTEKLSKTLFSGGAKPEVLRAALLACLEKLNQGKQKK